MKNADMPAMPSKDISKYHSKTNSVVEIECTGFTKREEVLKDFMAAMLSNPNCVTSGDKILIDAVKQADAYFKELEK